MGATVIISEPETVKTQDGYTVSAAGVKGTGGTGTDTLSDTNFNSTVFTFTMPEEGATVTFTNEKKVTVDTGVSLDIIPFILIITLTVPSSGAMLLEHRRRRRNER